MLSRSRSAIVAVWTVAAVCVLVPSASAFPGGPWASSSAPLKNYYYDQYTGAAYGVWQGYRENQDRGSRVQDGSYHRYPNPDTKYSDRGSYVHTTWYTNGSYCYLSSFSNSGGSVACSSGWHGSGSVDTGSTKSKSWQYWESWDRADPTANSGRGKMQVCEDLVSWPNNCSTAYFVRGAHY